MMDETKNECDAQPSGMSIPDAFISLANRVEDMEHGCKHAFMRRILTEKSFGFLQFHEYYGLPRKKPLIESMIGKAVMYDNVDCCLDDGILSAAYEIISMQELDRFAALESYDGVFTADDFKRAYVLNDHFILSYLGQHFSGAVIDPLKWLDRCYSDPIIPMTVPLLAAEERSLEICEALVQDVVQDFSFEKHSPDEMLRSYESYEFQPTVRVDALGEASKSLAEGMPIEFVKETALMASDDGSIPGLDHIPFLGSASKMKQDYVDSLNHRAMYVAYHLQPYADDGRIFDIPVMQPYADDETVEAWFDEMKANGCEK